MGPQGHERRSYERLKSKECEGSSVCPQGRERSECIDAQVLKAELSESDVERGRMV